MRLDGRLGDAEFIGDLLVEQALREHHQHPHLLRRQRGEPPHQRARLRDWRCASGRNRAASTAPSSTVRIAARIDSTQRFGHIGRRAELEAMADHRAILVARNDDHRRGGRSARRNSRPENRARPASSGRAARGPCPGVGSSAAARLSKSLRLVNLGARAPRRDRLPKRSQHQRMIVGNQNAHGFAQAHLPSLSRPARP